MREGISADVREAKEIYEENRRKMMDYHSRLTEMLNSDRDDLSWVRDAQSELADAYYNVEASGERIVKDLKLEIKRKQGHALILNSATIAKYCLQVKKERKEDLGLLSDFFFIEDQ